MAELCYVGRDAANAATATITNPRIGFGYPALFGNANHHDASVWIAGSGATKHVTDQKSVLNNYVNVPVGRGSLRAFEVQRPPSMATATFYLKPK